MIPQQIDPPAQTRFRKILDLRFSRKRMQELEPAMSAATRNELHRRLRRARRVRVRHRLRHAAAVPRLPLADGPAAGGPRPVPRAQERHHPPAGGAHGHEAATEYRAKTGKRIYAYFENIIEERTAAPRDDMVTYFTQAELDGRKLTRNEILDIASSSCSADSIR